MIATRSGATASTHAPAGSATSSACRRCSTRATGSSPATSVVFPGCTRCSPARTGSGTSRFGRGDEIVGRSVLHDVVEKEGRFAGRSLQQIYRTEFVRSDGATVARADSWCFRTERDTARGRQKYGGVEAARWSPERARRACGRLRGGGDPRGRAALVRGRIPGRRRCPRRQGPPDCHWRHRLRPGLGKPLHPCPRVRERPVRASPGAWHPERAGRARAAGARALGSRSRAPASAFRRLTTTAPNGSRGSDRSPRTGWATTGSCGG